MAVTYVGVASTFENNPVSLTTPSGTTGDTIVTVIGSYDTGAPATPPWVMASATFVADFTLQKSSGRTPSGTVTEGWSRETDGTEDASYSLTIQGGWYGEFACMVRATESQVQTSGGGGYVYTGGLRVPAHDVDTDGSLAVFVATGYNSAINDTTMTGNGWTSRVSLDSGYFRVYTKSVDAGTYSEVSVTSDSDGQSLLIILEPVASGNSGAPVLARHTAAGSGSTVGPPLTLLDATSSGNNTATNPQNVAYPAHSTGDLIVQSITVDANISPTIPATGPNGETIITILDNATAGTTLHFSAWAWIATGDEVAGNLSVALSASEQTSSESFRVAAGDFDPADPISDISGTGSSSTDSTVATMPSFTSTEIGRVVVMGGVDVDPMDATASPAGWTDLIKHDQGAVSSFVAYRDALTTASESVASANFGINPTDSYVCVGFVIKQVGSGSPTGTSATTLVRHTAAGSGSTTAPAITGTSATTLVRHAGAGSGSSGTTGTSATTLTRVTGAGSGTTAVPSATGSGTPTLARATGAGSGSTTGTEGSSATTLTRHTAAGSGSTSGIEGASAATLTRHTAAGAGSTTGIEGSSATTLARVTGAGSGTSTPPAGVGSGSPALARHVSTGTGSTTVPGATGSGAPSLVRHAATGSGSTGTTGSGTQTRNRHQASGSGSTGATGSAAVTLIRHVASGSGTVSGPASGSAAVTLVRLAAAGAGVASDPGADSGDLVLARHILAGSGTGTASSPVAQIPFTRLQGAQLTGLTKDARRTEILRAKTAAEPAKWA